MEYNPLTPEMAENPFPVFRWMRDNVPVYYNRELDFYAISRFEDVIAASWDHQTFCNGQGISLEGLEQGMDTLLTKDEPQHHWNRKLLTRRFTVGEIAQLESHIRDLCGGLLDAAASGGEIDVVTGFASRLPMEVIGELLGCRASSAIASTTCATVC